ncbi:MAG: hypothetical protein J0L78_15185 [Planctomycetes bacterium]|nr:hypothetical protein [Planctomycetota bacterium]
MKRFLRRIGAIRSTIMAAGIVAAAVGVQVVRADEHMPGFPPHICVGCCDVLSGGGVKCTGTFECQVLPGDYPTCACIYVYNSQGQLVNLLPACVYGLPQ